MWHQLQKPIALSFQPLSICLFDADVIFGDPSPALSITASADFFGGTHDWSLTQCESRWLVPFDGSIFGFCTCSTGLSVGGERLMATTKVQRRNSSQSTIVTECVHTLHCRSDSGKLLGSWIVAKTPHGERFSCGVCGKFYGYAPKDHGKVEGKSKLNE